MRIPDQPGLYRDHQKVGEIASDDPWSSGQAVMKSWGQSFEPEENGDPDGSDYWFTAEVEDVDFDIHFRLGRGDDGALVVTGLLLGNPGGTQAITTSNLHRLPIGAIYEAIAALDNVTTALAEKARPFQGAVPSRGGQRSPTIDFIIAARTYKQCVVDRPNDPIKCVAEKLAVSSATASRRVSRARDMNLLSADATDLEQMAILLQEIEKAKSGTDKEYQLKTEIYEVEHRLNLPDSMRVGIPF